LLQAATQKLSGDVSAIVTFYPESYYRAMDGESVQSDAPDDFDLAELETEQQQDFEETIAGEGSLEARRFQ
jgi:hypothetical protein